MSDEIRLAAAFVLAFTVTALVTPWARRLALRIGLLDHPSGYKQHARVTPYLGGAAVVAGTLLAATAFADGLGEYAPVTACVFILCGVGILDDRLASVSRCGSRSRSRPGSRSGRWGLDGTWQPTAPAQSRPRTSPPVRPR